MSGRGLRAPSQLSPEQKKVWYLSWACLVIPVAIVYSLPKEWQGWLANLVFSDDFMQVLRVGLAAVIIVLIVRRVRARRKSL